MKERTTISIKKTVHKLVRKRADKRGLRVDAAAEQMIQYAHKHDKTK